MHWLKSASLANFQKLADWLNGHALLVQPYISAHRKWPEMVLSAFTNQVWTKITIRTNAWSFAIQIQIQAVCLQWYTAHTFCPMFHKGSGSIMPSCPNILKSLPKIPTCNSAIPSIEKATWLSAPTTSSVSFADISAIKSQKNIRIRHCKGNFWFSVQPSIFSAYEF